MWISVYVDCRIFSQLISILSEKIRSWTNVLLVHRPKKLEPGHLCAPLVIEPELRYITSIPIIFIFVFFRALFWCFSRSQNDLKVQLIVCNSGNSWRSRRRPVCVNVGSFCSGKVAICSKSDLKSNLPVTRSPVFTCAINLCPVTSLLLSAVFCLTAVFFCCF